MERGRREGGRKGEREEGREGEREKGRKGEREGRGGTSGTIRAMGQLLEQVSTLKFHCQSTYQFGYSGS